MAKTKKTTTDDSRYAYIGTVKVKNFNYSKENYTRLYLWLYKSVLKDYKFRKRKIGFLFEDGQLVKMQVRIAIINLMLFKPWCDYGKTLQVSDLYDTKLISEDSIAERMDWTIKVFKQYGLTVEQLCDSIARIRESLATICLYFSMKIGNTLNMRDFIDLADKYPKFDEIIHTEYDEENLPPTHFIENDIMDRLGVALDIVRSDRNSNLKPFIMAGGNINLGQLAQLIVCVGPRSDIYGNIAPVIINTNFIRGLRNASDFYIESFAQRKALVANKYQMCDSGYTTRQIGLSGYDASLVDVDDCGSEHTLKIFIPNEKSLKMMEFKEIVTGRDEKGHQILHEIDPETDKHLIGTTVEVRSHIFCSLPQGQYCCTCYGGMRYTSLGYQTSLLAALSITATTSQMVLSTKHLNKTHTKIVEWPSLIREYFDIQSDGLYLKQEQIGKPISIGFYTEDIEDYLNMIGSGDSDSDDEDDENQVLMDYITRIRIRNDSVVFDIDNVGQDLYINSDFLQKLLDSNDTDDDTIWVNLSNISSDEQIFDLNIENIEISGYLKRLMSMLGIKSKTTYTTVEDLIQLLMNAFIEIGLKTNFAHIESMIYSMIRDPEVPIDRPNFRVNPNAPYSICPISRSIMYSHSLTTSLAFERIGRQLKTVFTYLKCAPGFLDPFFN